MDTRVILVTCPDAGMAAGLARTLVEEGLAACGNVIAGVRSIYRWEGKTCDEPEVLLLLKSRLQVYDRLEARIRSLHPYTTPEILSLAPDRGFAPYLAWVAENTK